MSKRGQQDEGGHTEEESPHESSKRCRVAEHGDGGEEKKQQSVSVQHWVDAFVKEMEAVRASGHLRLLILPPVPETAAVQNYLNALRLTPEQASLVFFSCVV